jgi:magnesium transporter
MVIELSHASRAIHDFRDALAPHREMLLSLEPASTRMFGPEFGYYLRDLLGTEERVERTVDNLHSSLVELRETNNSLLSTKQNEVMKTLTVMAFIFLPLTFIGQLFGMSLVVPLADNPYTFWMVISAMFCVGVSIYLYFRHKGWL